MLQGIGRKAFNRLAIFPGSIAQEIARQGGNILLSIAQGWKMDLDGVEAEKEILPKSSCPDLVAEEEETPSRQRQDGRERERHSHHAVAQLLVEFVA